MSRIYLSQTGDDLDPVCYRVQRFISTHFRLIGGFPTLDWGSLKQAIDYQSDAAITFDVFETTSYFNSGPTQTDIIHKVVQHLDIIYNTQIDPEPLEKDLETICTTVRSIRQRAFAHCSEGTPFVTREVHYVFICAFPGTRPHYSNVVLITIKITAEATTEYDMWFRKSSLPINFSAHIAGMRLIVDSSFDVPLPGTQLAWCVLDASEGRPFDTKPTSQGHLSPLAASNAGRSDRSSTKYMLAYTPDKGFRDHR